MFFGSGGGVLGVGLPGSWVDAFPASEGLGAAGDSVRVCAEGGGGSGMAALVLKLAGAAAAAGPPVLDAAGGRGGGPGGAGLLSAEEAGLFSAGREVFGAAADVPTRDKSGVLSRFVFGS